MAACRTVLPFATVTCRPSIVSVTDSIRQRSYQEKGLGLRAEGWERRADSSGLGLGRAPMSRTRPPLRLTHERGRDVPARHRREPSMATITPFLWFDTQAEDAMN